MSTAVEEVKEDVIEKEPREPLFSKRTGSSFLIH